jgi:hypothetical protein
MILPFIDYVLTKYDDKVVLYSTEKNIPGVDCHLEFLRTQHHLMPKYFFDEQCFRKYKNVLSFRDRIIRSLNKRKAKKNIRYISYIFSIIILIIKRVFEYSLEIPIGRFADKQNYSDKIMVTVFSEGTFPNRAVVKIAEKRSIKTVAYDHGFFLYANLGTTNKSINMKSVRRKIYKLISGKRYYCSSYITGNSHKDTWFRSHPTEDFKELDRVYEISTPRYTKEWVRIFRERLMNNKQFIYGDENKLNVVFFLSQQHLNVNEMEFINTLQKLSKIDNINFVYKPHTRGFYGIDESAINGFNASNVNSILLSAWADVGIVFGSSIGLQLLLDNVPIIVPSYIHFNTYIIEKYKICITANSLDDLITILSDNTKEDIVKLIDNRKKEEFLNRFLDAGKSYDQIMQEYYEAVVDMKFVQCELPASYE